MTMAMPFFARVPPAPARQAALLGSSTTPVNPPIRTMTSGRERLARFRRYAALAIFSEATANFAQPRPYFG